MIRGLLILPVLFSLCHSLIAQPYSSLNNYTGDWLTSRSWLPVWEVPRVNIYGYNITINGYISSGSSISFSGWGGDLIINDTLVINGDLYLDDYNDLIINNNGILIVKGNLKIDSHTDITADGYVIITGNIIKFSYIDHGSFRSNDDPAKVFIGGNIFSDALKANHPNYPVLDTVSPSTGIYPGTTYGYGNLTDLIYDPIYAFFKSTCPAARIDSNSPVCEGNTLKLTADGGSVYNWNGPDGFCSNSSDIAISNSKVSMSGQYSVIVSALNGCIDTAYASVTVNPLPVLSITSSDTAMCLNDCRTLCGKPAGGTFYITNGPGFIVNDILTASGTGDICLEYSYSAACSNKISQNISVFDAPVANAGPDQDLKFVFETRMKAELSSSESGEWYLIHGSGKIIDKHSPTTAVIGLSEGENKFLWKVQNGNCESVAKVMIVVHDLFVPSVITPNGDGKNDVFKIHPNPGKVELSIFNRWGNAEYTNDHYENDWDGKNNDGEELSADTYFYILKTENGGTKKGSVLIIK